MYAKVKESNRWPSVKSCGGVVFNKKTFVKVPPGREEEALHNSQLETAEDQPVLIVEKPEEVIKPENKERLVAVPEDENLSKRTWTTLKQNGLPDLESVKAFIEAKGEDALSDIDGIGKKALGEILGAVKED